VLLSSALVAAAALATALRAVRNKPNRSHPAQLLQTKPSEPLQLEKHTLQLPIAAVPAAVAVAIPQFPPGRELAGRCIEGKRGDKRNNREQRADVSAAAAAKAIARASESESEDEGE
jgi:hypothetical protein